MQTPSKYQRFELYWMRETGCDTGVRVSANALETVIRPRVLELAGGGPETVILQLPFLDRREWRRRAEVLRATRFEREGNLIRPVAVKINAAIRNRAALLCGTDPGWLAAPDELDAAYVACWRNVALRLQQALRKQIPGRYFANVDRYEDREAAYPMLVYQASRPFNVRSQTDFTYDVADPAVPAASTRLIGRALRHVLQQVESRLHQAGNPQLARRYMPIWHEDVLRAVQKTPRPLLELLAQEAILINAIIDLGTSRRMTSVKPFSKIAATSMRHVYGMDMRELVVKALDATTEELNARVAAKAA